MKKGKLLAVALIALLLAGGLVLASCRAGCDGPGNCEIKGGKGNACTNGFSGGSACGALKAAFEKKDGKCDC